MPISTLLRSLLTARAYVHPSYIVWFYLSLINSLPSQSKTLSTVLESRREEEEQMRKRKDFIKRHKKAKIKRILGSAITCVLIVCQNYILLTISANMDNEENKRWLLIFVIELCIDMVVYQLIKILVTIKVIKILSKKDQSKKVADSLRFLMSSHISRALAMKEDEYST